MDGGGGGGQEASGAEPWTPCWPGAADAGGVGGAYGGRPWEASAGPPCGWALAAGESTGTGGADGAGGTAVPSFSVLTASLLDPRLSFGRTRSRSATLVRADPGSRSTCRFVCRQLFPRAVRAP
ncbi:hypothetical protein GCM10018772_13540 [Streptomyces fumanus]|uniref:Uncharacterized protein n=1 Tax=Streptomyces fumanus TaxID=67302 RepID=A0A919A7Q7_9ACTN|nr:hypothetical protein GCM10018772_13540 [Streptomyces fumanus]